MTRVLLALVACSQVLGFRFLDAEPTPKVGECAAGASPVVLYADDDGDGVGNDLLASQGCLPAAGWVAAAGDCDDTLPEVHAGAPELCNERDDDCDDAVDEAPAQTWCADSDADGFGDPGDGIHACAQPSHYVDECTDCDDDDATVGGGCGGA